MGRSRGGLSTEVGGAAPDEETALAVDGVPGQAGDAPLLAPLSERTPQRVPALDEVVAGKGLLTETRCGPKACGGTGIPRSR